MALAPSHATAQPGELEPAPLRLPRDVRLTPEQFERVCQANPEAVLELAVQRTPEPLRIFDSSTGFRLPDGSVLSPDASLVREERWQAPTPERRRGFPPLCPDLVVELAGSSEEGPRGVSDLRRKIDTYQANGARLGWLLLPEEQAVEIWRGGQPGMAERQENASRLDGGVLAEGFALELEEIWGG